MCHYREREPEWFAHEAEDTAEFEEQSTEEEPDEPEVEVKLDREGTLATDD